MPTPAQPSPAPVVGLPEEVVAQDYQLKLYYAGKSSEGVRMKAGPRALAELPSMLAGIARSDVEVVEPLPLEFAQAVPQIVRPSEAMQWLNAHHQLSPITRHALVVLESIDAVDLAFDTFACALLDGETDTSGYPGVQRGRRRRRLPLGRGDRRHDRARRRGLGRPRRPWRHGPDRRAGSSAGS